MNKTKHKEHQFISLESPAADCVDEDSVAASEEGVGELNDKDDIEMQEDFIKLSTADDEEEEQAENEESAERSKEEEESSKEGSEEEIDIEAVTVKAAELFEKSILKSIKKSEEEKIIDELIAETEEMEKQNAEKLVSQRGVSVYTPYYLPGSKKAKKRLITSGKGWYDLLSTPLTPETKRDLQVLNLRQMLDRRRKYKKGSNPYKKMPKFFQIGTIIGGPADFYSGRLTRKLRSKSLAEQLLADAEQKRWRKRKFLELQQKAQSGGKKAYFIKRQRRKAF